MGNSLRTKEGNLVVFGEEDNGEVESVFKKYLIEEYPDIWEAEPFQYGKTMRLEQSTIHKHSDGKHKHEQEWYTELVCAKAKMKRKWAIQ